MREAVQLLFLLAEWAELDRSAVTVRRVLADVVPEMLQLVRPVRAQDLADLLTH